MKLIKTWYRSLLADDRSLWCESSDPEEVLQMSKGREVIFQKYSVYEVTTGWGKWNGTVE